MLNTKSTLTIKIAERIYEFCCDPSAPLGEIHDCLTKFKQFVVDKITEAQTKETIPAVAPTVAPAVEENKVG
jgi:hypothetical protein